MTNEQKKLILDQMDARITQLSNDLVSLRTRVVELEYERGAHERAHTTMMNLHNRFFDLIGFLGLEFHSETKSGYRKVTKKERGWH